MAAARLKATVAFIACVGTDSRGDELVEVLASTHVLLTQLEVPLPAIMTAMRLAQQSGAQIILDAAPPIEVPDELLQMVDVLRANTDEAEQLTGINTNSKRQINGFYCHGCNGLSATLL